jgi:hypothetical protein
VAGKDDSVREGTVSMSHAYGDLPGADDDVRSLGSNPGRLVANDDFYDPYSGQPRVSNIPVSISAHLLTTHEAAAVAAAP